MSARKGVVTVRDGKGGAYREVPLNSAAREALKAWLEECSERFAESSDPALFLNPSGRRLSPSGIDLILRKLAQAAALQLSAHVLRHTCLTKLVRAGNDLVLVAEIGGHKRLETTRRYTLPICEDRAAAMEGLVGEDG